MKGSIGIRQMFDIPQKLASWTHLLTLDMPFRCVDSWSRLYILAESELFVMFPVLNSNPLDHMFPRCS